MPDPFVSPLADYAPLAQLRADRTAGRGPFQITGCVDSEKEDIIRVLAGDLPFHAVITYNENRARAIAEDLEYYRVPFVIFPAKDMLFYSADIQSKLLIARRLRALKAIREAERLVVVTTVDACLNPMMPSGSWTRQIRVLRTGDVADPDELRRWLVDVGYEWSAQVEEPGQFGMHGGILDVFPLAEENPLRIEFWGDEIDSLRSYDRETQRSLENLNEVQLYPAAELLLSEELRAEGLAKIREESRNTAAAFARQGNHEAENRIVQLVNEFAEELTETGTAANLDAFLPFFCGEPACLLDYLPEGTGFILDEPDHLEERLAVVTEEFTASLESRLSAGYLLPAQADLLGDAAGLTGRLRTGTSVYLSAWDQPVEGVGETSALHLPATAIHSYRNAFDQLVTDMRRWKREGARTVLLSASRTRAERLANDLNEYGISSYFAGESPADPKPGTVMVTWGDLRQSFEYTELKFVVITESDIFGRSRLRRRRRPRYDGARYQNLTELSVGDYVVHENHGVGIYRGIEKITVNGTDRDYIKVSYRDNGNLYLPVTSMNTLMKYTGTGSRAPRLNKLGGSEWKKTRSRVKSAVSEVADDLVQLYAARQSISGYACGPDTVWQREFEELFPYEETEDQRRAIEETKRDMESRKVMDRLICGDVGFGKTEIALRAAFKAVQESRQVAYLVPTTVLAQQHYRTFTARMESYPVRVDLLSRFATPAQIRQTLKDLERGLVDVVIGTHRLLSADVHFKDLGLLIIDEEQRFGVRHKEKIKQMKQSVDVLTLTATPTPRTLHMSLAGIRDMSVLTEAPMDRVPIQTYVMEFNEELIKEAVHRELARGGQVYYVHNRVEDISEEAARLAELIPGAKIVYAHGQMSERELERIMLAFVEGEIDVLVSTTIIETGLDIPNVNTIIIRDAERFGLAQLYQLRGRVGRSDRTAYAFLMYTRGRALKEAAEKRLSAIREYTELGSGLRIAMRDLEIRGAGNLLGASQHGHMDAVGYDLYCKLLNQAVRVRKGEAAEEREETCQVDLDTDAFIPDSYILNEAQKLDIYRRISSIRSQEDLEDMRDELTDRFGDLPASVENLLAAALLRARAEGACVTELSGSSRGLRFLMDPAAPVRTELVPPLLAKYRGSLRFTGGEKPGFRYTPRNDDLALPEQLFARAGEILTDLRGILEEKPAAEPSGS